MLNNAWNPDIVTPGQRLMRVVVYSMRAGVRRECTFVQLPSVSNRLQALRLRLPPRSRLPAKTPMIVRLVGSKGMESWLMLTVLSVDDARVSNASDKSKRNPPSAMLMLGDTRLDLCPLLLLVGWLHATI